MTERRAVCLPEHPQESGTSLPVCARGEPFGPFSRDSVYCNTHHVTHLNKTVSMRSMIPALLLYTRLFFALFILLLLFIDLPAENYVVLGLLYIGILSDLLDGIIARRLNISTDRLRVQDTFVDLLFYLAVLAYVFQARPGDFTGNLVLIIVILSQEALMYITSLARFGKLPSPHAILSKFWGILMVVEFSLLLLGVGGIHFTIALIYGIIVHLDRLLIYLFLKKWDHDIPSSFHAWQIRKGLPIRRHKLFNG